MEASNISTGMHIQECTGIRLGLLTPARNKVVPIYKEHQYLTPPPPPPLLVCCKNSHIAFLLKCYRFGGATTLMIVKVSDLPPWYAWL